MRGRAFPTILPFIAALLVCCGQTCAQLADSPWPCFRHDQFHSARSEYTGPTSGVLTWTNQVGGTGLASPAVGDDRIYVVSSGLLIAVSFSGEVLWSYDCGSTGSSSPAIASNGTVYVASSNGYLYAVSSSGSLVWKKSLQGASDCSPTIGTDGTIYVGGSAKKLLAFYASGTQKFCYTSGGVISSSAAIASDGTIYFGCEDGYLYALYSNGSLKWKFAAASSAAIKSSPAIGSDGRIYFGTMAGHMYAVRPAGTQIWRFASSGAIVSSPAIASDGSIIFGSRDGSLYCLNTSGSQQWKYYVGSYVDSSAAIDSVGNVYFGSSGGSVYALDESGSLIWSASMGTGVTSSPAIGDQGTLYVLSYDGTLSAFGSDTTPPPAPTVTDDGVYSTLPTTLHASWACDDPESGIKQYEYAIGTAPGEDDLVAFTSVGTATEITCADIALVNGADYYFSVRATNRVGLVGDVGTSDGIRVDYTPPTTPLVIDDGDWTSSSGQLHIVFGSGDTESGIERYEYSIGTAAGLSDIFGWTDSGTTKERTITGLALSHGVSYYASVRAYNHAGLMSEGHSGGIKPDLTKPVIDNITTSATSTQLKATISASDPESGISETQYALLTSPDVPSSPDWQSAVSGQEFVINGSFDWNTTYYLAARAQNSVGVWSDAEVSDPIQVDDTAPSTPIVTDDGAYSTDATSLHASWSSQDAESGIKQYAYCVGTSAGSSDTVAWMITTQNSVTLTGLALSNGGAYYFTIRATNGAGLESENGSSDGITIDTTAPSTPVVTDDGDFTYSSDSLHAAWTSTDNESGIYEYLFCVGTTAGASDIACWQSSGSQAGATVSGLSLQTDMQYYFTVKAKNNAGLTSEPGYSDGIEYQHGVTVWPKYRCDSANTGCSVVSASLTGNILWYHQTQGYVESSAAIAADGTIYIGSSDGVLYAFNSLGTLRWSYQTGGCIDSSPAIDSCGNIYVGSYDGCLYCISSTGELRWKYQAGGMIWSSPNLASDGTIIFGCQDGRIYAVKADGTVKWKYTAGGAVWSSPAIGTDGSIYFGCSDSKVYALTSSGSTKWTYQTGSAIDSSPAVDANGVVYIGSGDSVFYALNSDGTKKWSKYIGFIPDSSAAIDSDGNIYFGAGIVGSTGVFYALDSNGTTLWHMSLSGAVKSSPAIAHDGIIYFGCADGSMYAVDPDGTQIWKHKVSQSIMSSPALGPDGSVIIGSDDGCVYCFRDSASGDTTAPATPAVTIDDQILTSGQTLDCSWSASDPESGIQYYSYAIGTQPGCSDVIGWKTAGRSVSAAISTQPIEAGAVYYVCIKATNWASLTSSAGSSEPFTIILDTAENSIGQAKQGSSGSILLKGKVVSAVFDNCVYVEELNRTSGIRCATVSSLEPGALVNVSGVMSERYGEKMIDSAVLTDTTLQSEIKPFYMRSSFITLPYLDPTGLLVRVCGMVTDSGEGYLVISDGSKSVSERSASGIEIRTDEDTSQFETGDYVIVTGIVCREMSDSETATVVRSTEDISTVARPTTE
ncbi:PQQ-binding-like beta-propeller repeat protein [bacterium]|nr:PQQ-binding-like beta-propeller repeat protein [bacterium]